MRTAYVSARIVWPAALAAGALVVILWAGLVVRDHQLRELQGQVSRACGGAVARLDLSDWVPLCVQFTAP
jgi:hypothetical protein